jgi:hypothetical protein
MLSSQLIDIRHRAYFIIIVQGSSQFSESASHCIAPLQPAIAVASHCETANRNCAAHKMKDRKCFIPPRGRRRLKRAEQLEVKQQLACSWTASSWLGEAAAWQLEAKHLGLGFYELASLGAKQLATSWGRSSWGR